MEKSKFEMVLQSAGSLPGVKIDREKFLTAELRKYCPQETIDIAVQLSPHAANISMEMIDTIAKRCIAFETNKVSLISFAAGIPGGFTMIGTIPADIAQYFGHILRIVQKLAYLYDWEELFDSETGMDNETESLLILFIGVMFGVNSAAVALTKIAEKASERVYKVLVSKTLTKTMVYPIVKKVSQMLGIKMTKDIFAKNAAKIIPVVGGVASGGLTYATYRPMAAKLHKYLRELNQKRDKEEAIRSKQTEV